MSNNGINEEIFREWFNFFPRLLTERKLYCLGRINFEIRSKEKGTHNCPHLHVSNDIASLVVDISTCEIIENSGKMKCSKIREVQNWIEKNRGYLMECWNNFTDSDIKFDLKKYNEYGEIKYSITSSAQPQSYHGS